MDFPEKLRKRIAKTIHSLEALAKSPLFMDTLIIDEIINFYRDAIKVHRKELQAMVRFFFHKKAREAKSSELIGIPE